MRLAEEIRKFFKGEVYDDEITLKKYSRDASLFEIKPKLVIFPKDTDDLKALVRWIGENPGHSVTVRAAGSDMTGGPLNESIIADVSQHMNHADEIIGESVAIQPGVFYRDFEKQTLAKGLILPCFPASKNLCALGGMISNNCAGERTLRYGKMENYVLESKIIFSDGKEYSIKPLNQTELEVKIKLIPEKAYHDMIALFFQSWNELPQVVNAILPYGPESLETFDDETLKLGIRFMPEIAKRANSNFFSFALKFIPEALIGARMFGLPKLVILAEVAENTDEEVKTKVHKIIEAIKPFNVWHRIIEKDSEENKFWVMRRESFNLLRQHVGDKRTAPFVDDFCIAVEKIPEFLPRALKILKDNGIVTNIAGHAGNGNFHIIPLMDLKK